MVGRGPDRRWLTVLDRLPPADSAPLTLAAPAEIEFTDTHRAIMETLGQGGAFFFRQLADAFSVSWRTVRATT